ncbi:MAG TPA: DUF3467 domain-containing protein [Gemmata sp.]|nr:DUF3467 domain-containing protein [Gemmata sp.]
MSDQSIQPTPQTQQMQVPINDGEMESIYVNFFRVTGNPDEVLLDLGIYSQVVSATGPEPVNLTHRMVMNFVTAKKLSEVLKVVVDRNQQMFGVIEIDPNRRLRQRPVPERPVQG